MTNLMDLDTIIYIVSSVILAGILMPILLTYRSRRLRSKRMLLTDLFTGYFRGDVLPDQLGPRARQIASGHFIGSSGFYSLAIAAFQGAVDATLARQAHSQERQKELLRLLAALKTEFGLTDYVAQT